MRLQIVHNQNISNLCIQPMNSRDLDGTFYMDWTAKRRWKRNINFSFNFYFTQIHSKMNAVLKIKLSIAFASFLLMMLGAMSKHKLCILKWISNAFTSFLFRKKKTTTETFIVGFFFEYEKFYLRLHQRKLFSNKNYSHFSCSLLSIAHHLFLLFFEFVSILLIKHICMKVDNFHS